MRIFDRANFSLRVLCVGVTAILLGACATAGDGSSDPDGGRTDGPGPGPTCGDNVVDPGEACDGTNLNGQDCQSQGFEGGILACDVSTCSLVTDNCYRCGDGTRNGDELCDGADLGGATCESLGYLGGTLACDPGTCAYDISACQTTETLSNDDGMCDVNLGCNTNDGSGSSGNPQSLVECFHSAALPPPFWLTEISYSISSAGGDQPNALDFEVYAWTGTGPPGALLGSEPVPANGLTAGPHTIALNNPIEVTTQDFCVGLHGTDPGDGFRILFSDTSQEFGTSYFVATSCGVDTFDAVANIVGPGNWCIGATIDKVAP